MALGGYSFGQWFQKSYLTHGFTHSNQEDIGSGSGISTIIFDAAKLLESHDESEFATILLFYIFYIYLYKKKLTLVGQYFIGKMLGFTKPDNCVMSRN